MSITQAPPLPVAMTMTQADFMTEDKTNSYSDRSVAVK